MPSQDLRSLACAPEGLATFSVAQPPFFQDPRDFRSSVGGLNRDANSPRFWVHEALGALMHEVLGLFTSGSSDGSYLWR